LAELERAACSVVPLPDVRSDGAGSYWWIAVHDESGTVLAVDSLFSRLLQTSVCEGGFSTERFPWPLKGRKAQSAAFVNGKWWFVTCDEWFDEAIAFVEAPNGRIVGPVEPRLVQTPALPLYGCGSAILPADDHLALFDSLEGLHWLNDDLEIVDSIPLDGESIVGPTENGKVAIYEQQGDGFRISRASLDSGCEEIMRGTTRPWTEEVWAIACLSNRTTVVMGDDSSVFIWTPESPTFRQVEIDWAQVNVDAIIDQVASSIIERAKKN